jgi:hypothetical protein
MQRICSCCGETIMDPESDKPLPLEFDSPDPNSLCGSCEEQKLAREASVEGVPWDIYLNCPAGSERKQ